MNFLAWSEAVAKLAGNTEKNFATKNFEKLHTHWAAGETPEQVSPAFATAIIEAQEMTVTYADNSTMVNSLENKVVERDGETYTVFNTRGGPCFHYQVGQNHVTAIEFK